jgi:putative ABC transport system permease protein
MPDWAAEIRRRLAPLGLAPEREEEIVDEIVQHLDDRYRELRDQGASEELARRTVFDEIDRDESLAAAVAREERRAPEPFPIGSSSRGGLIAALRHDVRYALRTFRRNPAFSAISLLTIALGISATTLIFSVVNSVILRPLPDPEPNRLVTFWGTAPEKGLAVVEYPDGLVPVIREETRTLESMAVYQNGGFNLTNGADAMRVNAATATGEFFRVMRVPPLLGRTFVDNGDRADSSRLAVIGYGLWQRQFGGDSAIIGRTIHLNANPATVIGVMPMGFEFPNRSELWLQVGVDRTRFNCWCWSTVARMKRGVTPEDVRRDVSSVIDRFAMQRRDVFPNTTPGGTRTVAMTVATQTIGSVKMPLLVLLGAVGCVLLIVCANVANLLLARANARTREMALRCCLGASRRRMTAQVITESLLLSGGGTFIGLAVTWLVLPAIRALSPDQIARIDQVVVDARVMAFAALVCLAAGLLFGLAPALTASHVDLTGALKDNARGGATRGRRRMSDVFVIAQFALSLMLLIGAGLLLRSVQRLMAVDLGFSTQNVLAVRIQLPYPKFAHDTVVRAFYGPLLQRVQALPGVTSAGLASRIPLTRGNPQDNVVAEGHEPRPGEPMLVANIRYATPGYFDAIGTPLVRGRLFDATDTESSPRVAIIDETVARRYWPHDDPIGKRIRHGGPIDQNPWLTIVGVVRHVRHASVEEQRPDLEVYEAFAQRSPWTNYVVVRTAMEPAAIVAAIRQQVRAIDPSIPLYDIQTMEELVSRSLGMKRLTSIVLAGFAVAALLLAAVGIYGVLSLNVTSRVREFGVRLALGAQPSEVLRMVLRQASRLVAIGVAIGLLGVVWVTKALESLLYGITPWDPVTFVIVSLVLAAVALSACWIPARRATRTDPVTALRAEV